MQNLHRHSSYSNIFTKADSSVKNEPYAKRSVELGHKVISSVEHGWQGYYFETFELAHEYGLKCVIGSEAYWVPNRNESDSSNRHILILAKNNNGREYINDILSEASLTGYYYKPRIDIELLKTLPKDDVFVTTACLAFGYNHMEESERYIDELHEHFGDNFCLEIQYHNTDKQKMWNEFLATMHDKYDIDYIVGYDSHYIFESESVERDYLLEAKDIHYADEVGWFMDYPTDEEAIDRFLVQGIFDCNTVKKAMDKTDIALTFDDYDDVPIFQKDIKLPTLYPGLSQEQKNKIYTKLITKQFKKYMKNIPESEYDRYFQGIKEEVQTYKDTKMTDYPLLDYEIVKDAVAHGGVITSTGRGSAASFMTNTLCGFSQVDRFTSAIKLYPERFMSTTRILETKSLPDIDLNVGTVSIFEDSQKRILGDNHVYPMIAFGTLKKRAAFKIYAKAKGLEFELANTISAQIGKYDEAVKNASDDEKDMIDINDYVDIKYQEYLKESEKYWGIISDKKKAPSAYLLYQGDIRREIGLIKCKSDSTKKEYICCVIDGAIAEKYKFLKNDILKVDSVLLIKKVFDRIGIPQFDTNTLIKKVTGDQKVWDIYKNGYTVGINQVEQEGSRQKCMRYKPHNVSELSAFVAAVRPGFKSMYSHFENREHFEYGIPSLDSLIQTKEMPVSYILYQEQVMSILNYAGFPMDQCYGIIKAIAKKKPEKVKSLKEKFRDGFRKKLIMEDNLTEEDAQKNAERVWTIVNDNCKYSFNSSHAYCMALDSLYQAWQKAYYPYEFYEVLLQHFSDKGKKDKVAALKAEMKRAFGISEGSYSFRNDHRVFRADEANRQITSALLSIKGIGDNVAGDLYKLSSNDYVDFISLLVDIQSTSIKKNQLITLIKLGLFSEFGNPNELLREYDIFSDLYGRTVISKANIAYPVEIIKSCCDRETEKQFRNFNDLELIRAIINGTEKENTSIIQQTKYELELLGYIKTIVPKLDEDFYIVQELQGYNKNIAVLYRLQDGDIWRVKVRAKLCEPLEVGFMIKALSVNLEPKWRKDTDGKWIQLDEKELVLKKYSHIT